MGLSIISLDYPCTHSATVIHCSEELNHSREFVNAKRNNEKRIPLCFFTRDSSRLRRIRASYFLPFLQKSFDLTCRSLYSNDNVGNRKLRRYGRHFEFYCSNSYYGMPRGKYILICPLSIP